jgi:hypothetical protein
MTKNARFIEPEDLISLHMSCLFIAAKTEEV